MGGTSKRHSLRLLHSGVPSLSIYHCFAHIGDGHLLFVLYVLKQDDTNNIVGYNQIHVKLFVGLRAT